MFKINYLKYLSWHRNVVHVAVFTYSFFWSLGFMGWAGDGWGFGDNLAKKGEQGAFYDLRS